MNYKSFNKGFLMLSLLLITSLSYAQTGINTRNPQGVLHVDGAKDNPATGVPGALQTANDFIITPAGWIGVGNIAPKVKFDLRGADNSALGLGTTTMSAISAGKGAVRYDVNNGIPTGTPKIQISDGLVWSQVYVAPIKAVVVAQLTKPVSIPYNTPTTVNNWTLKSDVTNSFNAVTGVFTAPRDGIYTFLMTFDFVEGTITPASTVETQFVNGIGVVISRSYKTFGRATRNAQAGGSSTVTLGLIAGSTMVVKLQQTIVNASRALRITGNIANPADPSDGFNSLTIIEQ
ncbi:hypothetical protein [Pedobacter punctiformis]|uniref:C1q domain-containing protein n=1 Tax=Pedobacter punctiformis TaxID=3004097 RepID=A0ABT4LFK3_9SPHI|nr:hypothetical protein [Pedobacter sp. HCMS5-2]MCZ4245928.1 hypothetical protein [Pedobacter sp. HCMS5-2]